MKDKIKMTTFIVLAMGAFIYLINQTELTSAILDAIYVPIFG